MSYSRNCPKSCSTFTYSLAYFPYFKKWKWAYAISMLSVSCVPHYQLLKRGTNLYETWYVYYGTWASHQCVCLYAPTVARQQLGKSSRIFGSFYNIFSFFTFSVLLCAQGPPLWSVGQSSWLQMHRSRVWFPALPDFLRSSGSGTGSTQPREDNWGATWMEKCGSGVENWN
jgi:hypothetical protein